MTTVPANALFWGRRMACVGILALLFLAAGTSPSLAATIHPIEGFKKSTDPSVAFAKNTIDFYGLRIKETKEDVVVSYNGKKVASSPAIKFMRKELYIKDAYVADDYPRQGMRTLFIPTFSGGANCCVEDVIVTKTEKSLAVAVVHSGSGSGVSPEAVKADAPIVVSSVCAMQVELRNVDKEAFGWCTATAPRPDACLVFDDDAWRFAKSGENPALYNALLQKELAAATDPGNQPHYGEPLDKEVVYANAVNILFYSIMAGKSEAESSDFLHRALPGLDAEHRRNFITNVKKAIADCDALTSKTIRLDATDAAPASPASNVPPRDAASASGRFTRTPCGSIADAAGKLEWFIGPDVDMTFDQAMDWAKALAVCGQGWVLPTMAQLASLRDPRLTAGTGFYAGGKHWPARIDPLFSGIGGGSWVWSREEPNAATAKAYNFNQGTETRTGKSGQGLAVRAFAVRGLASAP
ncbi:MAG: hypothetical protein B193_2205 [Solidesulfovibrio magneticus str. Maddingley MBC34]|uniref:Fibrobacter succinogenes major paralogous domain-containing protein n=1 Tax=Solidesulfovibrio magneticus str. Maddingley MBC34 TaxID=1206767 RepID=K6H9D6_9BACT|nr:MAG: hypothetical protein B193_2205 [Solidesulfovibrio magneticus str. Maddingley MBC34]